MADDKAEKKDKSDLVNEVMDKHGIPSWEAWDLTVPELRKKLEADNG